MFRIFFLISVILLIISCKTTKEGATTIYENTEVLEKNSDYLKFSFIKAKEFNHPSFVIWLEDLDGNYIETLFITESVASGIFKNRAINDSIWTNETGASYRPAALPYWFHKKGLNPLNDYVPTPESPFVDAYSGATPQGDFIFKTRSQNTNNYRVLVEINQSWDWNEFWTNKKFPKNKNYLSSAQPSLIYAARINLEQSEYYLNPIGHGSFDGSDGKLHTNLNTLTTAINIFSEIKLEILTLEK